MVTTIFSAFISQSASAEYIQCSNEGQQSYINLDTPSMTLSISEPLPIPGNDNAFKGYFQMTELESNTYSVVLAPGQLGSIQFCAGEKSTMVFSIKENKYKLNIYSECPNAAAINYFESNLSCTPY